MVHSDSGSFLINCMVLVSEEQWIDFYIVKYFYKSLQRTQEYHFLFRKKEMVSQYNELDLCELFLLSLKRRLTSSVFLLFLPTLLMPRMYSAVLKQNVKVIDFDPLVY